MVSRTPPSCGRSHRRATSSSRWASRARNVRSSRPLRPPSRRRWCSPLPPGTPDAPPRNTPDETQVAQMIEAIDWATRENARRAARSPGTSTSRASAWAATAAAACRRWRCRSDPRIEHHAGAEQRHLRAARRRAQRREHRQVAAGAAARPDAVPGRRPVRHRASECRDDVARIEHVPVFFGSLPVGHGGTFWTERDGGDWARVADALARLAR